MSKLNRTRLKPSACLQCRARHLKCDYISPQCGRCSASRTECIYLESRRGQRGGRRKKYIDTDVMTRESSVFDQSLALTADYNSIVLSRNALEPDLSSGNALVNKPLKSWLNTTTERMIDLFYHHFHPSHPFVIPRRLYQENKTILPDYLKKCMVFAASGHTNANVENAYHEARAVFDDNLPEDLFSVQALLIFTITSNASCRREAGAKALTLAIQIAMRIGMANHIPENFRHHWVWRESWLRTWWQLHVISTMVSLVSGMSCRLKLDNNQIIPGEEDVYEDTSCKSSNLTLDQLLERYQQPQEIHVSSTAYLIEASCLLGQVLDLEDGANSNISQLESRTIDAAITAFLLSIPESKKSIQRTDGTIDEVMLSALMMVNLAGICLHYPKSAIARGVTIPTSCNNDRPVSLIPTNSSYDHHSARALQFSNSICDLIIGRTTLDTITPCFACALTFATTTHLSSLTLDLPSTEVIRQTKTQIQLALTVLKTIGKTWNIGSMVHVQLTSYASDILKRLTSDNTSTGSPETYYDSTPNSVTPSLQRLDGMEEILSLEDWLANPIDVHPTAIDLGYTIEGATLAL